MKSWRRPGVPRIAGFGLVPQLWDTATQQLLPAEPDGVATLYVCGITPYDATHLGHASTYLAYDTLIRAWLDAGFTVSYVQNVTDIDDPLLERAAATGVDWRALAASQTDLFRGDMEALGIIPPDHYVAVTDVIPEVASAVDLLLARGLAYEVDASGPGGSLDGEPDLYFDSAAAAAATSWHLGIESGYSRDRMLELFALRGGDPTRPGKRDPLDPLLWRGARHGEPAWQTVLGLGRPGWHIECSVIAVNHLGRSITVQGGGSDLRFPHHEFTAAHATALTGEPFANIYSHAGMVAYQGEKMSKSLGNLVLVSKLTAAGHDARVIRLALLSHHYRSDWEWTDADLEHATARLSSWLDWAARNDTGPSAGSAQSEAQPTAEPAAHQTAQPTAHPPLVERLRAAIGNDLDTPTALLAVDEVVTDCAGCEGCGASAIDAIHALLGIDLRG